jgi:hypothetical protein
MGGGRLSLEIGMSHTPPHSLTPLPHPLRVQPVTGLHGSPMAYTPFTVADVVNTWLALVWLAEASDPDTVKGRLKFEKERLAAVEKRRAGMNNPLSLMVYNVLGGDEQEYARALK